MKIEILNIGGIVITVVDNVINPAREVEIHNGHSWREYQPSEGELTSKLRRVRRTQLHGERRKRIADIDEELADLAAMFGPLAKYIQVTGQGAGDWNKMKAIADHAKDKRAWMDTATLAELEAYDPETDPDWPQQGKL